MDKGSYSANDTALIKILWSPRADVFPGMRAATSTASGSLLGTISMSQNGASCADPVSFSLSKSTEQGIEIRVPINTDCNGFNTRIIVTDPISNKVIADASIDTPRDTSVKVIAGTDWNQYAARVLCVIVFIVLIILMILLIKRKKQQIGSKTLLFLIILVTAFSTVQIARAYTLGALIIVPNYAPFMIYAQGSFEVYNKTSSSQSYKAGDTITITDYETPTWMRCSNGAFISVQSKASVKGPTGSILSEGYLSGNPYYPYWGTSSRTRNVKLNVPGTYTVTVTFKLMDWQIGSISANGGRETSFSKTISVPIPAANASPDLNVYFAGTHNGSVTVSTTTKREYDADIIKSSHDPNIWHITICVGPNSCSYSWATDTFVKITPTAVHLPFFDKWTGSCTGTFPECLIETDPVLSKAVTAYFKDTGGSINFTTDNSEGACNSPRSILLSWDKVSNASYYTLERSDNSSLTPISKIITPGTDTRVSYTDSDTVINGHTYYYELFTDLSSTVPVASSTIRAFVDGCPDPTVILTAVPVEVIASPTATAKLTWESDNTTSCVTSGDWVSPGTVGTTSPSGGVSTGALSSVKQYIYNITCSDAANNQTTDTATVNAIIDTGSLSLTCVPNKTSVLTAGEYVTFTATALPAGGYYYWDGSLQQSVVNSLSKMRAANSPPTFNVKDAGSPQRSATKTCDAVPVGPGGNNNPDKPIVSGMPPCVKPGQPFSITVNSTDQDFDDVYYSVLDEYTGPPATRYPSSTFTKQGANYQINLAALSGLGDHTLDITATDLHGLTSDPYISSPIIVSSLCEDPHQGTGQITLGAYKINDSASASTTILQIRAGKDVWLGWHKKDSGVDLTDYDCGGSVIKSNDNTWSQGVWSGNDFNNQGISTTEKFMKVSSPDIKLPLGRYTYQIVCTKLADPNNPEPDVANPIIRSNTVDVIVTSSSIQEL
jgi:hypothetical protein